VIRTTSPTVGGDAIKELSEMAFNKGERVLAALDIEVQDEHCSDKHNQSLLCPSRWTSLGQVELIMAPNSTTQSSPSNNETDLSNECSSRRILLPRSVKKLLIMSASGNPAEQVCNHPHPGNSRKSYYLFRHAPGGQPNTNLLILLHGAGDTHIPFDRLGQTMALPQTATLALSARGPLGEPLPLQLGHTWFQEMDYSNGAYLEPSQTQQNLNNAAFRFCNVLNQLIRKEQWIIPERVFLFGYGAGAALAMQVCGLWIAGQPDQHTPQPLGGAICVAGGISSTSDTTLTNLSNSPILLMVGENDEYFPPWKAKQIQKHYGMSNNLELHIEPNKGQGMIGSANEMHKVMQFLSKRLVRISAMPTT
jgi:predicted esterase